MEMKSRLKLTIFLLSFTLAVLIPAITHAQVPSSIDGVMIDTYPTAPAPRQSTTVSVDSYATDLSSASIIWLVDGKEFAKGTGKKSITVTAPPLGKVMSVIAVIMTVEGREVRKGITIKSGGVDLIWETDGYIPPFYKGKSLYAYQNTVRFTAMPHFAGPNGTELDPSTLVYKWTDNDQVVLDQSGYGHQTLTLQKDLPLSLEVQVEVSTKNGSDKAIKTISLDPGNPNVSFYVDDPLYGTLYNKSVSGQLSLTNQELNILAVPYTFSFSDHYPLTYVWSINDAERPDLSTNQLITLRTKGDVEGSSNILVDVRSKHYILEGAKNILNVLFHKKTANPNTTF
jgi:hypothetical protein